MVGYSKVSPCLLTKLQMTTEYLKPTKSHLEFCHYFSVSKSFIIPVLHLFGIFFLFPISGLLYDITGSFYIAFLTLGSLEAVAAMLTLVKPTFLQKL